MSLFQRLRTVTLAYSNNVLDRIVDLDSLPVVRQYIRDLEDAITHTEHEAAVASASVTVQQTQIDAYQKTIGLDTQRAQAFLAKNDEVNARLYATRIHETQVLLDAAKEQIATATANATSLETALAKMRAKHTEVMGQLRMLESQDRNARALEGATRSLKQAAAITSNDVSGSVDSLAEKIHQRSAVANAEFNRSVGAFDTPPDPLKDAAVDDILASLRKPAPATAA